jgi:hypothetical protein
MRIDEYQPTRSENGTPSPPGGYTTVGGAELWQDDFPDYPPEVADLPGAEVVTISGYMNLENGVKVYADPDKTHWIEIPPREILHCVRGTERLYDRGRSQVFVKHTTLLTWRGPASSYFDTPEVLAYAIDDMDNDRGN